MGTNKITGLGTPTAATDAATKGYVDGAIQGLDTKQSVVVATTTSGTLATSFANGSIVDGVVLVTGDRILIKDQASVDNGIYTVNVSGAPSRAIDFASGSSAAGTFVFVEKGTVNADSGWVCTNDIGTDIVATSTLVFSQFSGAGSILAGTGLTKTGNTLSVNASQTQITAIGTIATGVWNGSVITVPFGGTGASTFTSNAVLLGNTTGAVQAGSGITYATSTLTLPKITSNDTTATTSNSTGSVLLAGGLAISNATDATSSTNGGTFTTSGGLAVAKKAYIGTDLNVGGNLTVTGTAALPHGGLTGLTTGDDHTQYVLLAGRTGGQTVTGGLAASNNYTIRSTSNVTKGSVIFDETTATTSSTTGSVKLSGGLSISNTTDATSATNGGTFTTAGGLSVAKKAYIGTDLSVGGSLTVTGSFAIPHSGLTGLTVGDDHTQYILSAGRVGGQSITGGTAASNTYTIRSTSNVTKGSVIFDETTATTSSTTGSVLFSGGISISNTTDATSTTNGGTFTTAGGMAIAKSLYVGTLLDTASINVNNSTQNIISIDSQGSTTVPGKIIFTNTGGTGDFIITGDGGDIWWQGGGGRSLQMGAYHEVRLMGGRVTTAAIPFVAGSSATFNTIIQNTNDSIGLRVQANSTQTGDLTQWTSNAGTVYSSVDSIGNLSIPNATLSGYIQLSNITAPSNPAASSFRIYMDTADSLLKSRTSTGVVSTYQPCTTKGDISVHNGTTNVRLPVGTNGQLLVAQSGAATGLLWTSREIAYLSHQLTSGTNAGQATSGAFFTRVLNTAVYNPSSSSIALNTGTSVITLVAGTYSVEGSVPGNRCAATMARLFDITNSVVLVSGTAEFSNTAVSNTATRSMIRGIFTVASTITCRLEQRVGTTRATDGLGLATAFGTEVYSVLQIEKI
jgi:phosphoribosylanthranilate isomerase